MIPERASYSGQSYKLYDDYNDIHIFVEDAGFENLYKVLFRIHGLGVENIFSKNGKGSVLKAAKACKDPKCVFIVDRDWSDLLGNMTKLKNVVVLKMHSIECYLIDYDGFAGVVLSENPKCGIGNTLNRDQFDAIVLDVSNKLRPLFECFVAMQMCGNSEKGCSLKPGHFQLKKSNCAPDERVIANFVAESKAPIPQSMRDYFADRVLTKKGHGKYMLHYVWEGTRHKSKVGKIGIEKLMMRLAQLVYTQELEALSSEVKAMASTD